MPREITVDRVVRSTSADQWVSEDDLTAALARFRQSDWGEVHPVDAAANDRAVEGRGSLVGAYRCGGGRRFWLTSGTGWAVTMVMTQEDL